MRWNLQFPLLLSRFKQTSTGGVSDESGLSEAGEDGLQEVGDHMLQTAFVLGEIQRLRGSVLVFTESPCPFFSVQ